MLRHLAGITVALLVAGAIFTVLERLFPALPGRSWWHRRGQLTDLAYWFLNLVTRPVIEAAAVPGVVLVAVALGAPLGGGRLGPWIEARRTVVSFQPVWLQVIELLLLADLLGYWAHRAFHRRPLWRFHAVHHATTQLDWLSSVRSHPVNEALMRAAQVVPLFALGFRGEVLAGVAPLFTLYALGLHANVPWSFGPLRYVLASPAFHRWHHTSEERGLDRNFANLFPVWDLVFGTFHLPVGEQPSAFGVGDAVPSGFLGQLAWPFRRAARAVSASPSPASPPRSPPCPPRAPA
jgi:sterol desaturase/sphingolipid hydroxylase (fatty acid hydroxylase superfamily)